MGTQHANLLVDLRVIGADHAAFDGAHVVGVVEGKIRYPAQAAQTLAVVGSAVGFADIFDQRDIAPSSVRRSVRRSAHRNLVHG